MELHGYLNTTQSISPRLVLIVPWLFLPHQEEEIPHLFKCAPDLLILEYSNATTNLALQCTGALKCLYSSTVLESTSSAYRPSTVNQASMNQTKNPSYISSNLKNHSIAFLEVDVGGKALWFRRVLRR